MNWLHKNRDKIFLLLILLLTAFLTGYGIWKETDANAYYTATEKSMLTSWHNFFYASFDPGGFITVDKPALGFWLQCLFGLVFGVHGWSLILPEVICSVISVAVLYHIVKRSFGTGAGHLAALFLALTPVFIAATRTNNLDASLVMVCLFAVWAAIVAAEKGSLKHLLLSAVLLGIGFNIKMLQAYLYLPALAVIYFFTAQVKMKKRLGHLIIAAVVLLAVSLSWCLIVDLTPADSRPYVGSSSTNSALELALGYNGLSRLLGANVTLSGGQITTGPGGGMNEGGSSGLFRFFNAEMAGQASWLIVLAVFGMLALLIRLLSKTDEKKKPVLRQFLLWTVTFATLYSFFSVAGFFHRYYLITIAPCIATLSAIAVIEGLRLYRWDNESGGLRWQQLFLPAAILSTAAVQIYILRAHYTDYSGIFVMIILTGAGLSAAGLIVLKLVKSGKKAISIAAVSIGILGILAAPAFWAYTPIAYGTNAVLPVAGPTGTTNSGMGQGSFGEQRPGAQNGQVSGPDGGPPNWPEGQQVPGNGANIPNNDNWTGAQDGQEPPGNGAPAGQDIVRPDSNTDGTVVVAAGRMGGVIPDAIVDYMMDTYNGARFLVAVPNAGPAEPIIIKYGVGVMSLGGFKGSDNAISLEDFISLVNRGELQYFWVTGNENSEISRWVTQNGVKVDSSDWGGASGASGTLYDVSGLNTSI